MEGQGAGQRVVDGDHVPKEGIVIISRRVRFQINFLLLAREVFEWTFSRILSYQL